MSNFYLTKEGGLPLFMRALSAITDACGDWYELVSEVQFTPDRIIINDPDFELVDIEFDCPDEPFLDDYESEEEFYEALEEFDNLQEYYFDLFGIEYRKIVQFLSEEYGLKAHFQLPYNSIVDSPQIVIWYV